MIEALPSGLLGVRDPALIACGFRRSTLIALDVADLRFRCGHTLEVTLRRSEAGQEQ